MKYSRPLSCMGITIKAMSALSSEQCRHHHQGDARHITPRLSAFLLAFLFVLPIVWLGILLAGRGLRKETVINLRSESKETSVMAAKDQHYFTKGSGIDTMDIAGPKEVRERLDAKKRKGPKLREKERSCCSQCFYCTQLFKKRAKKVH